MSIDLGAYRLLAYYSAPAPAPTLKEVRQDARELKQAYKPQQPPPALAGLAALFGHLFGWLLPAPAPVPVGGATRFTISSFNILGSSHTVPGADAASYDSGPTRIRWAAQLLAQHHVDVVGFQELNNDQAVAFKQAVGDTYDLFPGNQKRAMSSQNSLAWRKDTWDFVKGYTVDITSHRGNHWPCPVVRLRNKQTGEEAYFLNFHNAPGYRLGTQQQNRDAATAEEVALIQKLERESGLPVIVTGDMNDKQKAYDAFHGRAGMTAANRGPMGIDWIFGSAGVSFKGFLRERGALERKVSDHGMLVTQARF